MKWLIIIGCLVMASQLSAQEKSGASNVIEGGKVVVDLLSVFKGSGGGNNDTETGELTGNCKKDKTADVCFKNLSKTSINVTISRRTDNSFKSELIVLTGYQECVFALRKGIYTYAVTNILKQPIRKAELRIETCKDETIEIQ